MTISSSIVPAIIGSCCLLPFANDSFPLAQLDFTLNNDARSALFEPMALTDSSLPMSLLKEDENDRISRVKGPSAFATVDEAASKAEAFNGKNCLAPSKHRRKKLTKRVPSLNNHLSEMMVSLLRCQTRSSSNPAHEPVLCARNFDLNSPSPIVSLPSPHMKAYSFQSIRSLSFLTRKSPGSPLPVLPSAKLIFHLEHGKGYQPLHAVDIAPPTASASSAHDPISSEPVTTAKENGHQQLSGLGIELPLNSALSASLLASETTTAKQCSLSGLVTVFPPRIGLLHLEPFHPPKQQLD
ncbi:hypothetical protein BT96DRAFT_1002483 [Gymnopus androsaceus JB14]|uniref:Uncharacterized protein n=1 Tax=Gymnopus androsaceus JB14 TaxID=1447944 RepID=A0A6A4GWG4_9AGAR|nr:hypothetical protein BT96DRAFT_1002483 [Gymnopus androsaceus JB14]